jgi:hypothetical protein
VDYEIQARKLAADARLRAATGTCPGPESMTREQIATTVTAISDLMQALRYATTEDKAEIYPGLRPGRGTRYPPLCASPAHSAFVSSSIQNRPFCSESIGAAR